MFYLCLVRYSPNNSTRWLKTQITFYGKIFIEATDWGEVLPLSGASYLQGIDEQYDGDTRGTYGTDTCGQAFTYQLFDLSFYYFEYVRYSFIEQLHNTPQDEPPNPYKVDYPSHYQFGYYENSWNGIFIINI